MDRNLYMNKNIFMNKKYFHSFPRTRACMMEIELFINSCEERRGKNAIEIRTLFYLQIE